MPDKPVKTGLKEKVARLVKIHKESKGKPSNTKGDTEPS